RRWRWVCFAVIALIGISPLAGQAGPPSPGASLGPPQAASDSAVVGNAAHGGITTVGYVGPKGMPDSTIKWTLDSAVIWALQNNPELAALRQQHGIAAAGVVIARTYPYNPTLQAKIF